jgi:hypothetical protein
MAVSERDARPGLQVSFEGYSASLAGELDDNVNGPRPILRDVDAAAGIVLGTPSRHIRSEAGVVPRRNRIVPEYVDETLRHDLCMSKEAALPNQA